MQQIKISKTYEVENPMSFDKWCKKYKVGSRILKKQLDIDMYTRKEYDFNKLSAMIKNTNKNPSIYDRILKAITA
jgi:hypothetical protein